jgi:hypothetical protein
VDAGGGVDVGDGDVGCDELPSLHAAADTRKADTTARRSENMVPPGGGMSTPTFTNRRRGRLFPSIHADEDGVYDYATTAGVP